MWWIDLAAMANPALVTQAVAMLFNVSESSTLPLIAVLTSYLRAKELLIVLDNCEHLISACAELIGTLLSACPRVRVLATSREALNISGETTWVVPSLAVPDVAHLPPLTQLRRYDAIQLFTERAITVAKDWRLADHSAPVVQVFARLDGIPLALELAAAQLKHFSVEQIATRLDDRFNLLANETRGAIPRHQTLRAAMDWSYDLLSDAERALLHELSVFAGGFTLEAVEAVCSQQSTVNSQQSIAHRSLFTDHCSLHNLLTTLADKSLVVVETRDHATRYRLLETVRQYAREKLIAPAQTQDRHCDYFVDWIEQAAPHLRRADALE